MLVDPPPPGEGKRARSRGMICPKFCNQPRPRNQRAQGRPGARRTRGLMCMRCNKNAAHEHTGLAEAPGLPCAMALRLIRDRPGDRLSCHHRPWKLSLTSDLTPASGRRTLTISPYANVALVSRNTASIASHRTVVTIAIAPLVAVDGRSCAVDLPDAATGIFLIPGLDNDF